MMVQLVVRHERLAEFLIIQPVTALLPARVALAIGVDRLLAQQPPGNALERARLGCPAEERIEEQQPMIVSA